MILIEMVRATYSLINQSTSVMKGGEGRGICAMAQGRALGLTYKGPW